MWKCKKCCRSFAKTNQMHSCKVYPLDEHFKNKENQRPLFDSFTNFIKENIGDLKVEALPCCIHLVSSYTFSGVWILSDKIKIDFMLPEKIENSRFIKIEQPSTNRYVYYVEISKASELDDELLAWLTKSYFLKTK